MKKITKSLLSCLICSPLILTSFSCSKEQTIEKKCDVIFESGSNSSLSRAGDYVDYLIDESYNPGTHSRWENGHSYNDLSIISVDGDVTQEDVEQCFGSADGGYNPWYDSGNPEDKFNEWPEYGFFYDYKADNGIGRWHLKFHILNDVVKSFTLKLNFINVIYVNDKMEHGVISYSKDLYFYFHAPNVHNKVEGNSLKNVDYQFSNKNVKDDGSDVLKEIAINLNSSFDISTSPDDKTMKGWANFLVDSVESGSCSQYRSNIISLLSIIEGYIFEYNMLYSDNLYYYAHWDNSKQKWFYTEKDLLTPAQREKITIDSCVEKAENQANGFITFSLQQTILENDTEQVSSIIQVNKNNTSDQYVFTSHSFSSGVYGVYLSCLPNSSSSMFQVTKSGDYKWEIFNNSEIKIFSPTFNFITNGCTNKEGAKSLLHVIFNGKQIDIL